MYTVTPFVFNKEKPQLNAGAVDAMSRKQQVPGAILQVLAVRTVQSQPHTPPRYRLILSDGLYFSSSIIGTQLSPLVEQLSLIDRCIVRLGAHSYTTVGTAAVSLIAGLEVICGPTNKIGDPQPLRPGDQDLSSVAPAAARPPPATAAVSKPAPGYKPPATYSAPPVPPVPQVPQPMQVAPTHQPQLQPQVQPQPQVLAARRNQPPPSATIDTTRIVPLEALNIWVRNWVIKVRVMSKTDMRTFNSAKGAGKVFSVDVVDGKGTEMRITGFNDAADRFFPCFEPGKIYFVANGSVKTANRRFCKLNNEHEVHLEAQSQVEEVPDDSSVPLPVLQYDFKSIGNLLQVPVNTTVDVIGVVTEVSESVTLNTKRGEAQRRNVTLVDDSRHSVLISLWERFVPQVDAAALHQVLACRAVRLAEFGGRSLCSSAGSAFELNPATQARTAELRTWFDTEGSVQLADMQPLTQVGRRGQEGGVGPDGVAYGHASLSEHCLGEVVLEALREDERGGAKLAYTAVATLTFVKHGKEAPVYYNACPNAKCNRKVTQLSTGQWHCEQCRTDYDRREQRYMLTGVLHDHTGSCWVNFFNEHAATLLGKPASELAELQEQQLNAEVEQVFFEAQFRLWRFRLLARRDEYNGKMRLKTSCIGVEAIDHEQLCVQLAEKLQQQYGVTVPVEPDGAYNLTGLLPQPN